MTGHEVLVFYFFLNIVRSFKIMSMHSMLHILKFFYLFFFIYFRFMQSIEPNPISSSKFFCDCFFSHLVVIKENLFFCPLSQSS
jgi:hypothetical protein